MASAKCGESTITMPALGRPFRLGMLYDRRSESLLEQEPLWSAKLIDQHTTERQIDTLENEVVEDDTFSKRAKALNMDDSLRLSSLATLVNLAGSAQYLKSRKSQNECQAALKLKHIASVKELDMKELKKSSPIKLGDEDRVTATHVVTAITMGSQCIFTLNQSIPDGKATSATSEIQSHLKKLATKMDANRISCKKVVVNQMDKVDIDTIGCVHYADHLNEGLLLSLEEMADLYEKFPGKDSTTIEISLHPMNSFHGTLSSDVKLIREEIVDTIQDGLEKLQTHSEHQRLDSQISIISQYFPEFESSLIEFHKLITGFIKTLEQQLASLVPCVRDGTMEEADLLQVVEMMHGSPFAGRKLEKWKEDKRKEGDALGLYSVLLNNNNVAFMKDSIALRLQTYTSDFVLCFVFKLPEDMALLEMNKSLGMEQPTAKYNQTHIWCTNQRIEGAIDNALRRFVYFLNCKPAGGGAFVTMTTKTGPEEPASTSLVLYNEGKSVSDNFILPTAPGQPICLSADSNTIELKWKQVEEGYENVKQYEIHYKATGESHWNCATTGDSTEMKSITNLDEKTGYEFRVRAVCVCGVGPFGETSNPIATRTPLSEPGHPAAKDVTSNSITIKWSKPEQGPVIGHYNVQYRIVGDTDWNEVCTTHSTCEATIGNLDQNSKYEFHVSAVSQNEIGPFGEISEPITTFSLLSEPGQPIEVRKTANTITIQWKKPTEHADSVCHYEVMYIRADMSATHSPWRCEKSNSPDCTAVVEGLDSGIEYRFKVRAVSREDAGPFGQISMPICTANIPSAPGKPYKADVSAESVAIKWREPENSAQSISSYLMKYRSDDTQKWTKVSIKEPVCIVNANDIEADETYQFRVCAVSEGGKGPFSEISDDIVLYERPTAPGKPAKTDISTNSITVEWAKKDNQDEKIVSYEVGYKEQPEKKWSILSTGNTTNRFTVENLESSACYVFRVRASCTWGNGPYSDISDPISTEEIISEPGKPVEHTAEVDSITVTWKKPIHFTAVELYDIQYKQRGRKKWNTFTTKSDSCQATIDGLKENSSYEFQVRGRTKDVEGPFGGVSEPISTSMGLPSEPGEPHCIEINSNSITIEWESPVNYPDRVSHYEILYRHAVFYSWKWVSLKTEKPINRATINGLQTDSKYEFKVQSVYQGNKLPAGKTSNVFSTSKPLPQPSKPFCSKKSESSVTIQWEKPACSPNLISQYTVRYRHSDSCSWIDCKTQSRRCEFTVEKLHEKSYQFQVCVVGHSGEGPYGDISDNIQIFQPPSEPGEPTKVNGSVDSVTIVWSKPQYNADGIQQYDVRYRREGIVDWKTKHTGNPACSTTVTGLEVAKSYEFQVRAMCAEGNGTFGKMSKYIQTFTPPSQPGKPVGLGATTNSITIKWQPAKHTSEPIHHYDIRFRRCGTSDWTMTNTDDDRHEATVDGLSKECGYEFGVRAMCLKGHGDFGETSSPIDTLGSSSSPANLTLSYVKKDCIAIAWGKPQPPDRNLKYYEVRYKQVGTKPWTVQNVDGPQESTIIGRLESATAYEVEVCAICKGRKGLYARFREPIKTKKATDNPPSSPGSPQPRHVTVDTMHLTWIRPTNRYESVEKYELWYTIDESKTWKVLQTETLTEELIIAELTDDTEYQMKVRAMCRVDQCGVQHGPFGRTARVKTKASRARLLVADCIKTCESTPQKYKIPVKTVSSDPKWHTRIVQLEIPKASSNACPVQLERTIMMVGATGSGKSTLVNGMMNYLVDTQFQDPFRFTLVDLMDDEKKNAGNQAVSQTDWITMYKLPSMKVGEETFNLNLVDTPGFGDTRGITRDKRLVEQISQFFKTVDAFGQKTIDAVCVAVSAPSARLTPTQKYIHKAILSIFGKNIAANIFVMITFSDGSEPPALSALKDDGIPFQTHVCFNNSALFENNTKKSDRSFTNMFWTIGQESYKTFFKKLLNTSPKSLTMTREVLQEREKLQVTIRGLQSQIREGVKKLDSIKNEVRIVQEHQMTKEHNKDYVHTISRRERMYVELEKKHHVTNCKQCKVTCHEDCIFANSEEKVGCSAMDSDQDESIRQCTVCEDKCHWSEHINDAYKIEWETISVSETFEDMKKRHEEAAGCELDHAQMLSKFTTDFRQLQAKVRGTLVQARKGINLLREKALKKNPMTEIEYLKMLITLEESEVNPGYLGRIDMLKSLCQQAELMENIDDPTFEPWKKGFEVSLGDQLHFLHV